MCTTPYRSPLCSLLWLAARRKALRQNLRTHHDTFDSFLSFPFLSFLLLFSLGRTTRTKQQKEAHESGPGRALPAPAQGSDWPPVSCNTEEWSFPRRPSSVLRAFRAMTLHWSKSQGFPFATTSHRGKTKEKDGDAVSILHSRRTTKQVRSIRHRPETCRGQRQ